MENIQQFTDQLIKDAGLDKMPEDFQNEYKEQLLAQLQQRLGLAYMKELSEDQMKKLNKLIEEQKEEEISKFLEANIPNLQEVMKNTLEAFSSEVMESAKKFK